MKDHEETYHDPIVAEIRAYREAYAARFNYDIDAIARALQAQEAEARANGWQTVTLPPRPVQQVRHPVA